jgi:hypothetical protein
MEALPLLLLTKLMIARVPPTPERIWHAKRMFSRIPSSYHFALVLGKNGPFAYYYLILLR